jgi:hypothetical protein
MSTTTHLCEIGGLQLGTEWSVPFFNNYFKTKKEPGESLSTSPGHEERRNTPDPPPPPREELPPRDPLLDAPRPELDEPCDELLELPRLCTTDGLIRTACDPFPPVLEDTPLLLPLNVRQLLLDDAGVVDAGVVDAGLRLMADVLPEEVEEGGTRCPEPAVRAAGLVEPVDDVGRAAELPALLAERAIACLC